MRGSWATRRTINSTSRRPISAASSPFSPASRRRRHPTSIPTFAFSYFQGGYEASLNVWGWKMGDFMVERAVETDRPARPMSRVTIWRSYGVARRVLAASTRIRSAWSSSPPDAVAVGTVTSSRPSSRANDARSSSRGSGATPESRCRRRRRSRSSATTDRRFLRARSTLPSTVDYTTARIVMLTRVRQHADGWEWVVYWEELCQFPRWRRIDSAPSGHHMDGDSRAPYETASPRIRPRAGNDDLAIEVAQQSLGHYLRSAGLSRPT